MARQASVAVFNNFIKGINTEASPINYVPDCTLDEENFELTRTGGRKRRLGIDYEDNYALLGIDYVSLSGITVSTWRWDNVNNDSDTTFFCVQVGTKLDFLNATKTPHSDNVVGTLTISGFSGTKRISYGAVNGQLVISTGETSPILIKYNKNTKTFSQQYIEIEVRDLWGVDDGLTITQIPSSLSVTHHYNLFNQGWYSQPPEGGPDFQIQEIADSGFFEPSPGVPGYPSNTMVWWISKREDEPNAVWPKSLAGISFGNTPAPKGYWIINAFSRGSSRRTKYTGFTSLPADTETGKISCVTSLGNRIFYSGVTSNVVGGDSKSPNYNGVVFFTKLIETEEDYSKCYQEADPTAEHISDIVDSDGGHIIITSAQNINALRVLGSSVLVFAYNGVWEISGDSGAGFKATGYKVNQITNVGCINPDSVVVVEDTIFYWAKSGIFQIGKAEITGDFEAKNISQLTIKTLYDEIPYNSKLIAKGVYDSFDKKLKWLYLSEDSIKSCDCPAYNCELIYDTLLQAFYKYRFTENPSIEAEDDRAFVQGHLLMPFYTTEGIDEPVVAGNDFVYEDTGYSNLVVIEGVGIEGSSPVSCKYLVVQQDIDLELPLAYTVAWLKNPAFIDWETIDAVGLDYTSYMVTGYLNQADVVTKKAVPYVFFYFEQTEKDIVGGDYDNPSSCLVRSRWDWANSTASNRWGSEFQAYRLVKPHLGSTVPASFDYGYDVVVTKNKLRGYGKALSLYITSETNKDLRILGWGMQLSGATVP